MRGLVAALRVWPAQMEEYRVREVRRPGPSRDGGLLAGHLIGKQPCWFAPASLEGLMPGLASTCPDGSGSGSPGRAWVP